MTAPRRPHAELAARLRNIECSLLDEDENATLREVADLLDPPTIKPTVTLTVNGRMWLLPKPLKGPFHLGRAYYVAGEDGRPSLRVWEHTDVDKLCQSKLRMNDTEADCQAWAYFDKWCRGGGA